MFKKYDKVAHGYVKSLIMKTDRLQDLEGYFNTGKHGWKIMGLVIK